MSDSSAPSSPDNAPEQVGFPDVPGPSDTSNHGILPGKVATEQFENEYYDEYDFYNLEPESKMFTHASGKGRSKREASKHSSRFPSQWGVLAKFENESNNRKRNTKLEKSRFGGK